MIKSSFRKAARLSLAVSLTALPLQAFNLSNTAFEQVGRDAGIDPTLLYALCLAESAKGLGRDSLVSPHPYTLRYSGGARYFDNRSDAENYLNDVLSRQPRANIDIGMCQINWYWQGEQLSRRGIQATDLLDMTTNLRESAAILNLGCRTATSLNQCIGRYNTWNSPDIANNYAERVLAIYRNLQSVN